MSLFLLLGPLMAFPILGAPGSDASQEEAPVTDVRRPAPFTTLLDLTEVPGLASVHQFSSHNREGKNGDATWHLPF